MKLIELTVKDMRVSFVMVQQQKKNSAIRKNKTHKNLIQNTDRSINLLVTKVAAFETDKGTAIGW